MKRPGLTTVAEGVENIENILAIKLLNIILEALPQVIFKLPIDKVLILSLLRIINHIKGKKNHLNDSTVAIIFIFHTHEIPPVTRYPQYGFTSENVTLDIECALINIINW